jgi:hypothetical protein
VSVRSRGGRLGDGQRLRHRERSHLQSQLRRIQTCTGGGPVLWSKLDVPVTRPVGQDPEDVAQVGLRSEAMKARRSAGRRRRRAEQVIVLQQSQPTFLFQRLNCLTDRESAGLPAANQI